MKRIHMAGRLGNQLFSWAFAHHILESENRVTLVTHTIEIDLANILSGCNHVQTELIKPELKFRMKLFFKFYYRFKTFAPLISKLFAVSNEPELFYINNSKDYCGYFQKYEYILENREMLFEELSESLEKIDLPRLFIDWQDDREYQCLHIRRGDFLLPENSGYGLLSLEWYRNHRKTNLRTVIVTDDKFGAAELLTAFEDCLVLGPEEANAFQTLSIMGKSAHLVAANSTLSWWGGFLAAMRGQSVIYPVSEIEKHRDINLPLFKLKEAIYE
jgi:hypothetical protein